MAVPRLSIIIVSYNSQDFIEKCLNSVLKNVPAAEIIVLDNASKDKTAEKLKKFLPKITLVESEKNLGFSKGNNRAVKEARGEYLFFLNPDTELKKPINELIDFYEKKSDSGIVAPKLILENGETQPSVRKLPTVWGAFKEYILGVKNSYNQYIPEGGDPMEVEMVYGAAILIKRDLFEKLGGFDEKYFLYYEDAELCKRVRDLSKKIYYYPKISINHLVGAAQSQLDRNTLNNQSLLTYHGLLGAFCLQVIFFVHRIANKLTK